MEKFILLSEYPEQLIHEYTNEQLQKHNNLFYLFLRNEKSTEEILKKKKVINFYISTFKTFSS